MTKLILFPFFFAFAAVTCSAQSQRIPSAKPDSRTCTGTIVESKIYETSRVSGLVVDTANIFVPNVLLELRSMDGSMILKVKNDAKGNFRFPFLHKDEYLLKARWMKKGLDCVKLLVKVTGSLEEPKTIVLSPSPVTTITELR